MKRIFCLLTVLVLALGCAFAQADEADLDLLEKEGRVKILSRFSMKVPNGHSVTTDEGYAKVFPYSGDEDRDTVMKVYFYEQEQDMFKCQLIAERSQMEAFQEMNTISALGRMEQKEHKTEYRTVMGIENCVYAESLFTVKDMIRNDDVLMINVFVNMDGGTYQFCIRSTDANKTREVFDLLETIERL